MLKIEENWPRSEFGRKRRELRLNDEISISTCLTMTKGKILLFVFVGMQSGCKICLKVELEKSTMEEKIMTVNRRMEMKLSRKL